jgi:hypothetical protein
MLLAKANFPGTNTQAYYVATSALMKKCSTKLTLAVYLVSVIKLFSFISAK